MLEQKMMAIINAENDNQQIQGLGVNHATPLLPVLSRYRLIDFVLSNIVNANIFPVYILTNKPNRHLFNYIGTGTNWDLNRKNGGISFIFSTNSETGSDNDLASLYKNLDHLAEQKPAVILFTNAHSINRIDYNKMYDQFMASDADVLWVYKVANKEKILKNIPILNLDSKTKNVTSFGINNGELTSFNMDLGIFMIKKELFLKLVNEAVTTNVNQKFQNVLRNLTNSIKIKGYDIKGWVGQIRNIQEYYQQQMNALLDYNVTLQVFTQYPLYTRERDEANTFYGSNASVSHSIVGSGVVIEGSVKNSIIFRKVSIAAGAKIENCIILSNVTIQENVILKNVIVDQDSVITANKVLQSTPEAPLVIVKKSLI